MINNIFGAEAEKMLTGKFGAAVCAANSGPVARKPAPGVDHELSL
jgi:hypothetical protein